MKREMQHYLMHKMMESDRRGLHQIRSASTQRFASDCKDSGRPATTAAPSKGALGLIFTIQLRISTRTHTLETEGCKIFVDFYLFTCIPSPSHKTSRQNAYPLPIFPKTLSSLAIPCPSPCMSIHVTVYAVYYFVFIRDHIPPFSSLFFFIALSLWCICTSGSFLLFLCRTQSKIVFHCFYTYSYSLIAPYSKQPSEFRYLLASHTFRALSYR